MPKIELLARRFLELSSMLDQTEATRSVVPSPLAHGDKIDGEAFLKWRVSARSLISAACGRESEHYNIFQKK